MTLCQFPLPLWWLFSLKSFSPRDSTPWNPGLITFAWCWCVYLCLQPSLETLLGLTPQSPHHSSLLCSLGILSQKIKLNVVFGLFLLIEIIQKPCVRSYFSNKHALSTQRFWDVVSNVRFELICKFFLDLFDMKVYHTTRIIQNVSHNISLFSIYPKIFHLNPFLYRQSDGW